MSSNETTDHQQDRGKTIAVALLVLTLLVPPTAQATYDPIGSGTAKLATRLNKKLRPKTPFFSGQLLGP